MKQRTQGLIAGILIGAAGAGSAAFAKSMTQSIEVTYDNIKVYKDNVLCTLTDSNGGAVEPFIYEGTTYMPVRGTAQLAGMQVTWDGNTKSVYLWDNLVPNGINLMDVCPPYDGDWMAMNDFMMAGNRYRGFTIRGNMNPYALVNLNGKYSSLTMTIGPEDGSDFGENTAYVRVILDGRTAESYEVRETDYPREVTIPLNRALQMKIEMDVTFSAASVGFGNITLQ